MVEGPSILLAVAAGFVSFISPCCLPLVPGYLATVCGKTADERATGVALALRGPTLLAITVAAIVTATLRALA